MALRPAPPLLLVSVVVILWESCFGASSHSLKYFSTAISEPSQGQPKYFFLGYVDDQVFVHYDSHSRRIQPRASWMEKVRKEDPQYWDRETVIQHDQEELSGYQLESLMNYYNQSEGAGSGNCSPSGISSFPPQESPLRRNGRRKDGRVSVLPFLLRLFLFSVSLGILCWLFQILFSLGSFRVPILEGLHTWQKIYGCELRGDGSKEGFLQYGYDGRTFNKETLARRAPISKAQFSERISDDPSQLSLVQNPYPTQICIEWLGEYLSYGKETLLRTEPPVVTVSNRTEVEDEKETLVCRVHGFYPREIDASWRRDGEVWLEETFHGSVAPNADGTYHYWLSIRIDPTERGHYRCHVEHDGLQEPLDVALEEVGEPAGTSP